MPNLDEHTVAGFGAEWSRFDQRELPEQELHDRFQQYFAVFPWDRLPSDPVGFDAGCGSGRWARLVAPRVGTLHCIDASKDALDVAKRTLAGIDNCMFHEASVDNMPLRDESTDFGYSLGVLHHLPDPAAGLRSCIEKLKPGAPFLLYVYYALDNKPAWYRLLWRVSDEVRKRVSIAPQAVRLAVSQLVALVVYLPLARLAALLERLGRDVSDLPLSAYRHWSFYTMRTDALDRLGTRVERRFSQDELIAMMRDAGLADLQVSDGPPYWCASGIKSR